MINCHHDKATVRSDAVDLPALRPSMDQTNFYGTDAMREMSFETLERSATARAGRGQAAEGAR
jgi:hypothetical protein